MYYGPWFESGLCNADFQAMCINSAGRPLITTERLKNNSLFVSYYFTVLLLINEIYNMDMTSVYHGHVKSTFFQCRVTFRAAISILYNQCILQKWTFLLFPFWRLRLRHLTVNDKVCLPFEIWYKFES